MTSATHMGLRYYQEDRYFTAGYEQGFLIGVFDGHGGTHTSSYAVEEFPAIFSDEIYKAKSPRTAMRRAVKKLSDATRKYANGSTLSVVWIPATGNTVTCAVIGDSPIIIKDNKGQINIGPDHNVRSNKAEAEAAVKRGGVIINGYLCGSRYSEGGLQMARALGDAFLDDVLLRTPDIYSVKVNKDSFVIVATDGAFDPGHAEFDKAAEAVIKLVEGGSEAQAIVDRALEIKTGDNVTAIVARFEAPTRKKKNGVPA